jgi:hypothetical protein
MIFSEASAVQASASVVDEVGFFLPVGLHQDAVDVVDVDGSAAALIDAPLATSMDRADGCPSQLGRSSVIVGPILRSSFRDSLR